MSKNKPASPPATLPTDENDQEPGVTLDETQENDQEPEVDPAPAQEPPPAPTAEGQKSYQVVRPIVGIDKPNTERAPGYVFQGDPATCDPYVKLGYLKHA